jgi:predicted Zn-dependent protease
VANLIDLLRRAKPLDEVQRNIRGPEDAVRALNIRAALPGKYKKSWVDLLSPLMIEGEDMDNANALASDLSQARAKVRASGMTLEAALEIGLTAAQYSKDGDDATGWVVRQMTANDSATPSQQVYFVLREGDAYRILAANGAFSGVARLVLRLSEQGKNEQATVWLDRVRQELPAGSGDDPLSGNMFSRFWQQGQAADPASIRTAAALLLSDNSHDAERVIPILEAAAGAAAPGNQDAITASLAEAYERAKRYDHALSLSEALLKKLPQSASALVLTLRAAYAVGGSKEAGRITDAYLSRFKTNPAALRLAALTAMAFGDAERSIAIERQLVDSGRAQPIDYNSLAWAAIFAGKLDQSTIEIATRGVTMSNNSSAAILHTLAAVEAELDRPAEARATLLKRMDQLGEDEPDDSDWYVFGRIAESYGLKDEAAAMYRRLQRPKVEYGIAESSYALAQRHLKAMGLAQ